MSKQTLIAVRGPLAEVANALEAIDIVDVYIRTEDLVRFRLPEDDVYGTAEPDEASAGTRIVVDPTHEPGLARQIYDQLMGLVPFQLDLVSADDPADRIAHRPALDQQGLG